jgi:hypothetical protein
VEVVVALLVAEDSVVHLLEATVVFKELAVAELLFSQHQDTYHLLALAEEAVAVHPLTLTVLAMAVLAVLVLATVVKVSGGMVVRKAQLQEQMQLH